MDRRGHRILPKNRLFSTIKNMSRFYIPEETIKIFEEKESALRIFKVENVEELERKGDAYRKSIASKIKAVKISKVGKIGGITLWKVNGSLVRDLIDDDFVMGGHGYRYLYIPTSEIWIDNSGKRNDWPVVWHEYLEMREMSRGMNYGDAHDLASQLEITMRRGEEFALPLNHFEQEQSYSCGAASLRIVFDFFGDVLTELEIAKLAKTSAETGTDARNMVAAAKALGYAVNWREHWTAKEVVGSVRKGIPVIANFQHYSHNKGDGHYAVIVGFTQKDEFIIDDPAKPYKGGGFYKIPISKFMEFWYELEDKTQREGIALKK